MGAEKPGYISEPSTITVSAGANTQDLTITKTSLTISGYVYADINNNGSYDSGEGLSFAFVHADKLGGGFTGTPADPDGSYTLYVSPGDWRLSGVAEGYQEKAYTGNTVTVGTEGVSGINILLTDTVSLTPPKAQPFKPASGATFDDSNAGLKISIPPMALGSETTDYQIQGKETSSLPSTPTAVPLGGTGKKVLIFDASGNSITTLNDDITIEMTYTRAELVAAGFSSLEEVAKVKIAYWDDSASAYVTIPTTVAYDPATETTWANLVSVTFKGTTSHLTVFTPIVTTDGLAPAAPTSLVGTAGNGQVTLTWTAPTINADSSALTDLFGYEIYRSTSATGTYTQVNITDVQTTYYIDTTVTNATTYYYKVTTADTGGNESVKSSVSNATTPAAPSAPIEDGGGGVVAPTITEVSTTGLISVENLEVNRSGVVQQSLQLKTTDEKVSLDIAEGTKLLDSQSSALDSLSASEVTSPSAPPSESAIVCAYDFGPDGATFEPAITLCISYSPESLPELMTEDELYIAYWDGLQWQSLESTVDAEAGTVSAEINHFTQFAVIGELVSPAAEPVVEPEVEPAAEPEAEPAAEPALTGFTISGLSITPSEVEADETVTVVVIVTNNDDSRNSYTVILKINGVEEATKQATVDADVSQRVRFSVARNTAGTYEVDVSELTGSFVVKGAAVAVVKELAPATFSLGVLSISPAEVEIGEEVTVGVTVTNAGGQSGSYEVTLKVDNAVVDTALITLVAGVSEEVAFTTSRDTAGSYTANINGRTGTFVVKVKETAPQLIDWWLIGGIIAGCIILGVVIWQLTIRRRAY